MGPRAVTDVLLVSQFLFGDNDLLHMPVNLPLYFLPVLGCVAQADTSDVIQVLGRKLELVNISPKKGRKTNLENVAIFFKYPPYFKKNHATTRWCNVIIVSV